MRKVVKKGGDVTPKCVSGVSGLCQHILPFLEVGDATLLLYECPLSNLWLSIEKVRLKRTFLRKINLTVKEFIIFRQKNKSIAPPITTENAQINTSL